MRDNKEKLHRIRTGRGVANAVGDPPVYTAERRKTMRQGLRILARMIVRAHLRREATPRGPLAEAGLGDRPASTASGPPTDCQAVEQADSETGTQE